MDPEGADDPVKVRQWTTEREAMDIALEGIARASNANSNDWAGWPGCLGADQHCLDALLVAVLARHSTALGFADRCDGVGLPEAILIRREIHWVGPVVGMGVPRIRRRGSACRTRGGCGVARVGYLTAPAVMPRVRERWKMRKKMTMGTMPRRAAALMAVGSLVY